ncbi:MAG: hypothetical protein H0X43_02955 [Nitrosospira sp.]|nr:hypothetical protein [Nitrosospira sp.]
MENPSDKKNDKSTEKELSEAELVPSASDEAILVDGKTDGNRANEKMKDRSTKKQETHEEAKSITGSQAHHDPRNENPDSGPAPLKRY